MSVDRSEEDRKLIQIVEYHQVLWDNRIKGYRDKKQTQHAWLSVAEVLERDVSDCMQRWTALRKQYSKKVCQQIRYNNNQSGPDPTETSWHLFSYMAFLKPCITPRKSRSNFLQPNNSSQLLNSYNSTDNYTSTANNYLNLNTSTEDETSSSMSEPEESAHLNRVNAEESLKKVLRSFTNKSREHNSIPPATNTSSAVTVNHTQPKEHSDNESVNGIAAVKVFRHTGPKSASSIPKPQSMDATTKQSDLKVKKLKMSSANGYSSVSKDSNGVLNDSKSCNANGYGCKGVRSSGCESKGCVHHEYDADEYFLLSLAPDLKKLSPRQKYEVKSKMLDIVSEQYVMD